MIKAVFLGPQDKVEKYYKCDICIKAKVTLKPYKSQSERNYGVGKLLHTDLVHAVAMSNQRNRYFLLVKNHASSFRIAYFQSAKDADCTVRKLVDAINMLET
jgi:hypothetical protein